ERRGVWVESGQQQRELVHLLVAVHQGGSAAAPARARRQAGPEVLTIPAREDPRPRGRRLAAPAGTSAHSGCATLEGGREARLFFWNRMTSSPAVAGSSSVERELRRIRSLLKERRFDAAVAAAAVLEAEVPENRDVLYLLALGQRQARRLGD